MFQYFFINKYYSNGEIGDEGGKRGAGWDENINNPIRDSHKTYLTSPMVLFRQKILQKLQFFTPTFVYIYGTLYKYSPF